LGISSSAKSAKKALNAATMALNSAARDMR
jgi:hypothetical protein